MQLRPATTEAFTPGIDTEATQRPCSQTEDRPAPAPPPPRALLRFVTRTMPDPSDADEVVREIWLAVIQGRDRYIARTRFVTYLFSIARRRSADRWRRHGVQLDPEANVNELETLAVPVQTWPESRGRRKPLAPRSCALSMRSRLPNSRYFSFELSHPRRDRPGHRHEPRDGEEPPAVRAKPPAYRIGALE